MAHPKFDTNGPKVKRLSALDIYNLTQEGLQEIFELDRTNCKYDAQSIWDLVIGAAAERTTLETICTVLVDSPSVNIARTALKGILPEEAQIDELEQQLNTALTWRLPKKLLAKPLPCAIDLVLIPYHGKREDGDTVRRGRAKSGTTHFHCYATLFTVKYNRRYTLALTLVRQSDKVLDVLKRLLKQAEKVDLKIKRLLLDREFDNNAVIDFLKEKPFPAIIPLKIRGKQGGTRALLKGRKSYITTYTRQSTLYPTVTFCVHVVCKYSKGRYKRQGLFRFAYVVTGDLKLHPAQVYREYRYRFGIETSYRLMNQVRARTTSRSPGLRLFFVGIALFMLNLWSFIKWLCLFVSKRGPRIILHHLFPLALWCLWLWEVVKQRLRLVMEILIFQTT